MRILVVEDEHRIAASIKKGLEQEKYAVDLSYTGTDGYDMAASEDYDLIILDLMLPGMDGLQVCQRLRSENNHVPILILTAKDQLQDKVKGLDNGADDYLTKPFAFEELLARIRALIRRPRRSLSQILKVADLELDTISLEVRRSGQVVQLSNKEFSLLEYLMRHPNQVVKKEDIIRHVWNYDADILPNTVEAFIKNIRKKIETPFNGKPQLIQTIRGFGYKLTGNN